MDASAGAGAVGRRADAVTDELVRLIRSGALREGAPLPAERDLMQRFQVSRAAVREAIAALGHRGLVETRLKHRPIVRRPGYEAAVDRLGGLVGHLIAERPGVRALFESRIFFEAALARHAARGSRREDVAELKAALAANGAAIGNAPLFYDTDVALHAVLYRIPGNPIFPAVHKAYVDWLMNHWCVMAQGPEIDRMNHAGHRSIVEAIEARDPDAAEDAVRRHLTAAWELVRSTLPGEEAPAAGRAA